MRISDWSSDVCSSDLSYTNNFPFDVTVGNEPTSGALLWSALSLVVLLVGIGIVLLAFGKFEYLGWVDRGAKLEVKLMPPGQASAGQKALLKFFVVVAALFLVQTLKIGRAHV